MSSYNIYFSPTGGTKKVADILAKELFTEYVSVDLCRNIDAQLWMRRMFALYPCLPMGAECLPLP